MTIKKIFLCSFIALVSMTMLCAQSEVSTKVLPKEGLQLPQTLDYELEQLLQRWYEGYERRSIAPYANSQAVAVPSTHDSVYINLMNRIPSGIRLSYNSVVRESIELYLYRRRPLLSLMLSLSDLYFPDIEAELDRHRLPLELKYLTIVESALNPTAISPAGAAGLWQFMLPTARMYGLDINSLVDERMDPIKGTEAACKMLKDLYRIYNDWWLVMAAYNCGAGNVNRAIARSGGKRSFWDIYPYLPRETRRYVPLYIGVYFAMYYAQHYGIQARELGRPLATEYFEVKQTTSFSKISSLTGLSVEQIKAYNPQFRRGIVPWNNEPYQLRLPLKAVMTLEGYKPEEIKSSEMDVIRESIAGVSSSGNTPKVYGNEDSKYIYHIVGRRETAERIAKRYGVSVRAIRSWNGLGARRGLRAGQRIIVGEKRSKQAPSNDVKSPTETETNNPNAFTNKGETSLIPKGATSLDPSKDRQLPPPTNSQGARAETSSSKEILAPSVTPPATAERRQTQQTQHNPIPSTGKRHLVQKGESLASIAMRYNTTVVHLRQLNGLKQDVLNIGDEIIVSETTNKAEAQGQLPPRARETESETEANTVTTSPNEGNTLKQETSSLAKPKNSTQATPSKVDEKGKSKNSGRNKANKRRPQSYQVKSGDTQTSIAKRHGITLKQLRQWNNLRSDKLSIGQQLRVSQ